MIENRSYFEIKRDNKYGRYLVAAEGLQKGTKIFEDVPLALGPKPDSPTVCLGCHKLWNGLYKCSNCRWPCCDENCEEADCHRNYECEVFSTANVKYHAISQISAACPQYECITPLRILLAKEKDPIKWNMEFDMMEDHKEERMKRPTWEADNINVVKYLRNHCLLEERFSEDLIQKVCGILEVNAVEIPLQNGPNIRGLYPRIAIMSHNCRPSITHTIVSRERDGSHSHIYFAEVWANTDLRKGDKLELTYTNILSPTIQRRYHLLQSKFFLCDCERCQDPTELGTNMSTLRCSKCDQGFVLPTAPLDKDAIWYCSSCDYRTDNESVRKLIEVVEKENEGIEQSTISGKEQALRWYNYIFHPQHSIMINLKYELLQQYGHVRGYYYNEMSVEQLQRKISLCQELIKTTDVISPGSTRIRGVILNETYNPMLILSKIEYKQGKLSNEEYIAKVMHIATLLYEAAEILSREDPASEKGSMGRAASKAYRELMLKQ